MESRALRIRRTVFLLMAFALLYFGIGGITLAIGWFPAEKYFAFGGVIGAAASVVGLFGLATMPLTKESLREQELEAMRSMVRTADELSVLKSARQETEKEIESLESRKQEMEFLVRKASLSLFLQERERLYLKNIEERLRDDKGLFDLVSELHETRKQLEALRVEIADSPNVEMLEEVVAAVVRKRDFADEMALVIGRPVVKAMRRLTGT